jgi:hypothetical protein
MSSDKIDQYDSLNPFQYSKLERYELFRSNVEEDEPPRLTLRLTLRPKKNDDKRRLMLSFQCVRDLIFTGDMYDFIFLSITDIRDRQWENAQYKVWNTEQDIDLKFYCSDFFAEIVENE